MHEIHRFPSKSNCLGIVWELSYVGFLHVLNCLLIVLWNSLYQTHTCWSSLSPAVAHGMLQVGRPARGDDRHMRRTLTSGAPLTSERVACSAHVRWQWIANLRWRRTEWPRFPSDFPGQIEVVLQRLVAKLFEHYDALGFVSFVPVPPNLNVEGCSPSWWSFSAARPGRTSTLKLGAGGGGAEQDRKCKCPNNLATNSWEMTHQRDKKKTIRFVQEIP